MPALLVVRQVGLNEAAVAASQPKGMVGRVAVDEARRLGCRSAQEHFLAARAPVLHEELHERGLAHPALAAQEDAKLHVAGMLELFEGVELSCLETVRLGLAWLVPIHVLPHLPSRQRR